MELVGFGVPNGCHPSFYTMAGKITQEFLHPGGKNCHKKICGVSSAAGYS
jgi:hypothetical protein